MQAAHVLGVGKANPPDTLAQEDARSFAQAMFGDAIEDLDRLLPIFANTRIKTRTIAQPLSWFYENHTFVESNRIYEQVAMKLSIEAASQALTASGIDAKDIGAVVMVSSTGLATPSLDVGVIQELGLSPQVARIPIWGLGCAGGVSGLARASELARLQPDKAVLLIAVELCTLTFQKGDLSKANLVAVSLFGDGAAALVLQAKATEKPSPRILSSHSTLFPETEYVMGWDLRETGLQVRFDKSIPHLVLEHLERLLSEACEDWQVSPQEIEHFVVHPGGARVLDAYAASLKLPVARIQHGYDVLRDYGNMSSPTVFYVLDQFLQQTPATEQYGVMLAWGPGFSAEQLLFQW